MACSTSSGSCECPTLSCSFAPSYLPSISWDLSGLQGPPVHNLSTAAIVKKGTTDPIYTDVFFDFCKQAEGSKNGGNSDGTGGGNGAGNQAQKILDEHCPEACGYAYAVRSLGGVCIGLGTTMRSTLDLLDTQSPAKGLQLTYSGAMGTAHSLQYCPAQNNALTVSMHCHRDTMQSPLATEYNECRFGVNWYTPYGCPTQCTSTNEVTGQLELCSNHGVCGYDNTLESAVCLCDTGFGGTLCVDEVPIVEASGIDGGLVFLIVFVILLLLAGLAFIAYMYWRLYKVQTAKARAAYDNLTADRDEAGNIQIHV